MKSFTLNRNSIHYKLAKKFGGFDEWDYRRDKLDFCTYSRRVLLGSIGFSVVAIIGTAFTVSVAYTLAWLAAMAINWTLIEPSGICALTFIVAALAVFGGLLWLIGTAHDLVRNKKRVKKSVEPGFVGLAYRKFKDKTCFQINLEG